MARLRRRQRDPEGRMSLGEHFREFRRRLFVSALAVVVLAVVGFIYYPQIFTVLAQPFNDYKRANPKSLINLNFANATAAFSNQMNLALFVGVIGSSPVWLYQAWAFIVPGLTRREKRISLAFIAAVVPLFLGGCAFAYWILPRSLAILYGFTPPGASNLQQTSDYFSFVTRFILAFGVAFLFPVFLVALNIVGVLPARVMVKGWRVAVVFIAIFSAVATPTPDPYTMLLLMAPLVLLYFVAVGMAWALDRKRFKDRPEWLDMDDDEASPLTPTPSPQPLPTPEPRPSVEP